MGFSDAPFRPVKPFLYQRLIRSLLLEVASGLYPEGQPFISFRQIGAGWKVSRETTEVALAELIERNILQRRDRSRFVLRPGAIERSRLMLSEFAGPELSPPTNWVARKQRLVGKQREQPLRIAVIVDSVIDVPLVMRTGLTPDDGKSSDVADGRWHLITFLRELQARPCDCRFFYDDGSPASLDTTLVRLGKDKPDGAVVFRYSRSHSRAPLLVALKGLSVPTLTVLDDCEGLADASIDFNHAAAGYSMMNLLVENGHRSIAVFTQVNRGQRFDQVCNGALRFIDDEPKRLEVDVCRFTDRAHLASEVGRLFGREGHPTAAVFSGIHTFLEVHPQLQSLGVEIPHDLSVIGRGSPLYENMQAGYQWVDLMDQDFGRIGIEAARLMLRLVNGEPVPHASLLEMPYLKRKSVRSRGGIGEHTRE